MCLYSSDYTIIIMKITMKMINRPRSRNRHKVNKKGSHYDDTWAKFESQFMKKLSNTEAELRKNVAYKKACIFTTTEL